MAQMESRYEAQPEGLFHVMHITLAKFHRHGSCSLQKKINTRRYDVVTALQNALKSVWKRCSFYVLS